MGFIRVTLAGIFNDMGVTVPVTPSNEFGGVGVTVCAFRHTVPTRTRMASTGLAVVGITGGAKFVMAMIGLVFVVWLMVKPFLDRINRKPRKRGPSESHKLLMQELRRHRHD